MNVGCSNQAQWLLVFECSMLETYANHTHRTHMSHIGLVYVNCFRHVFYPVTNDPGWFL